jgi:hypothetical protein
MKTGAPLRMLLVTVAAVAAACSPTPGGPVSTSKGTSTQSGTHLQQYTDPFAYCAAVGTVDSPGSPYAGAKVADEIISGYKNAAGLQDSTEPMNLLRQTTVWRCMDGKVYACNFGANLPCDSRADTSSEPTSAMTAYCEANPDAAFIPMSITGHATIYSWHCIGQTAATQSQIDHVDAAGFLERIWYEIQPIP